MKMPTRLWMSCLCGMFLAASASALPPDCNVLLTLDGAVATADGKASAATVEFQRRGGAWADRCFGSGTRGMSHTHGTVKATSDSQLSVTLLMTGDPWMSGGNGDFEIVLEEKDGAIGGSFKGGFALKGSARVETSGKVTGRTEPAWPGVVAGFTPLAPNEHPRLIFRKAELATLKKRAETPEGKAIMARLMKTLGSVSPGKQPTVSVVAVGGTFKIVADDTAGATAGPDDKFVAWPAVGCGFAWLMTGEKQYADKARAIIQPVIGNSPGGQDIHHGPRALGIALAFDLCYDGWDEAFRLRVIDDLQRRAKELRTGITAGGKMGGMNLAPWSNHNGIRMGAAGVTAMAVMGEKNSKGQELEDAQQIVTEAAYDTREWLRKGIGGGRYFIEGMFYKWMTLRRGQAHFLLAYEKCTGLKANASPMGDFVLLGHFFEAPPGALWIPPSTYDGLSPDYGVDGEDAREFGWALGLMTVPPSVMPGVKRLLDNSVGLKGSGTFGITAGIYAPYMMATYPFDVADKDPSECFPWVSPDPRKGHWVFRPTYKDTNDILVVTNFRTEMLGSCHYERAGDTMALSVRAFGKLWTDGSSYVDTGSLNVFSGPETLYSDTSRDKLAFVSMKLDRMYTQKATARGELDKDKGIRGVRAMMFDFTGECGAPVLIAIADKIAGAEKQTWKMNLPGSTADGTAFKVGDDAGPNLRGQFAPVAGLKISGALEATGAMEYLTVFTIQNGKAPEIKFAGEGCVAKVAAGARKFVFDGAKFVVEK